MIKAKFNSTYHISSYTTMNWIIHSENQINKYGVHWIQAKAFNELCTQISLDTNMFLNGLKTVRCLDPQEVCWMASQVKYVFIQ